ncbi:trichome birefringence-like protein 3, partial [Tanacetum coccineum]
VNNTKNLRYQPVKPKDPKRNIKVTANEKRDKGIELQNPFDKLADHEENACATDIGESSNNGMKLKNLFENLNEITTIVDPSSSTGEDELGNKSDVQDNKNNDDTNSEAEECGCLEYSRSEPRPKQSEVRQAINENQLSVCAILKSHVDLSSLFKVYSKVFRYWEWTSNASLCSSGCRNAQSKRRLLWAELGLHKFAICGLPWVLMGDFKVALNMEDIYVGVSSLNSAMYDFKDGVAKIKVIDINSSGLHYTWNQKPKGGNGVLKKLDRIMGNIEFMDRFPGHNMFKVVSKLKRLKKPSRKLLHDHGNLHDRVNKLRVKLDQVQKALDSNPDDDTLHEEESVYL